MAAPKAESVSKAVNDDADVEASTSGLDSDSASDSASGSDSASDKQRRKEFPLWKLVVSAIPWIGIQALWSTEFAMTTPYMKSLGMSDSWSSIIWIFGPITGFFTSPVVGCLSDRCQSKYGRRRPFILGGLVLLWVSSLVFASSGQILAAPYSQYLALAMFIVLDVVVNVIQTPVRAIVSDMASQELQMHGQIIAVLFQGFGTLLGFGIMKMWAVPYLAIFEVVVLVLSVLTAFIALQMWICEEVPYVRPANAPPASILTPFSAAFSAVAHMSRDLRQIALVQFFSWYSMFCYWPTLSTWFSLNVFGGSEDAPSGSDLKERYDAGQDANSTAGLLNAGLMILFSMFLVALMLKTSIPIRYLYAACLYVGAVALVMAKSLVGNSVPFALLIVTVMAVPVSAINAFPFALVGAMNKSAEDEGKEPDTGVQMGVLNIFICAPQLVATLVVGELRGHLSETALPWAFMMAGISFAIAGTGSLFVNDRLVAKVVS